MKKEPRMSSLPKRRVKRAAKGGMRRMRRVQRMSLLPKRRAKRAERGVMPRMRKEPHTSSARRKLAKRAGKVENHPTEVMDEAAPTVNLPRQLEVEARSSMRRPAAKAIKIAKSVLFCIDKNPFYL